MPIQTLELSGFRNHNRISLKFGKRLNVIWGANGTGKTSVLEAIHTLSIGRSFRTQRIREQIQEGRETLHASGKFIQENRSETIQLNQTADGQRRFLIDSKPVDSLKALIGRHPVVLLSPEEQGITKGAPAERRTFFDKVFSVVFPGYVNALAEYQRCLKQRNAALQGVRDGFADKEEARVWNTSLVTSGVNVWLSRREYFQQFTEILQATVRKYAGDIQFTGEHRSELDGLEQQDSAAAYRSHYQDLLDHHFRRDTMLGRTSVGPHRDRYRFRFNRRSLREYGSQGEHKLALVLIKLAEFEMIRQATGKPPTLLLDDLFAKLDFARSDHVLTLLKSGVQTIITTTDLVSIEQHGVDLSAPEYCCIHLERPHAIAG